MPPSKAKARLFVEEGLDVGTGLDLAAGQVHYLSRVLRLGAGDRVVVFNGRDGEWRARIESLSRSRCRLIADTQIRPQSNEPDLWLAFAPIKKTGIDFITEKATELGAGRLWPVFTRYTAVNRVNLERLRANAIEAAEQCERLSVPEIAEPVTLEKLIADWPTERRLLVPDETGGGKPIAEALTDSTGTGLTAGCGILIGPEGGFAPYELDELGKLPFVNLVGLGPRILRAETAALATLACWQALAGDWRLLPTRTDLSLKHSPEND